MTGDSRRTFGVRLQTHVWNPAGDKRALLLHGLGSDGTSWWRIASELARSGWMCVAPDLRSHGRSPGADDHRLDAMAADVALLGDGWDVVVAHSLGGAVAARLLDDGDTGRFTGGGVLIDPVLHVPDTAIEELRALVRADCGELDPAAIRQAHPRWHERDVQRKVLAARLVTPDVVDGTIDDNRPWDLTDTVARWRTPVHVLIAGNERASTVTSHARVALDANPAVTVTVVAGTDHSVHRDAPDVVLAAVDEVLAQR
ncbi:MAG: alpha/beta hydrolase [Nitriliruptoraceae bacterium]